MADSFVSLLVAVYLALGAFIATVYIIADWVGRGKGMEWPIVVRPRPDLKVPSRLYLWITFFVKVAVMWPWVIYTLLRSR